MDKNIVWNIYGSKQAVLDLDIQLQNDYLDYVGDWWIDRVGFGDRYCISVEILNIRKFKNHYKGMFESNGKELNHVIHLK